MAALLPKALELLEPKTPGTLVTAELTPQLQPFAQRLHDRDHGKLRNVARDCNFSGPLLQAWNAGLSSRAGFDHRLGRLSPYARPDSPYAFEARHVPQLLWENEYQRHFAALFRPSNMYEHTVRQIGRAHV